jgi:hypothetical protein
MVFAFQHHLAGALSFSPFGIVSYLGIEFAKAGRGAGDEEDAGVWWDCYRCAVEEIDFWILERPI